MPPYVHKRFRRLALYISEQARATLPFRQLLTELDTVYSTQLAGAAFAGIHSINLYLVSEAAEQERVEKVVVGYVDYYVQIDFEALAQLATDQQRQHYLLTVLQRAVRNIVQHEQWEGSRFERAYQVCLQQDLPVAIR